MNLMSFTESKEQSAPGRDRDLENVVPALGVPSSAGRKRPKPHRPAPLRAVNALGPEGGVEGTGALKAGEGSG